MMLYLVKFVRIINISSLRGPRSLNYNSMILKKNLAIVIYMTKMLGLVLMASYFIGIAWHLLVQWESPEDEDSFR